MTVISVRQPERLQFQDDVLCYGYDQEWYEDKWRRRAGCGPTVATQLLAYALQRDGFWPRITERAMALTRMNEVWEYVTPRHGGLYKTRWLKEGIIEYLQAQGYDGYRLHLLTIPLLPQYRPSAREVEDFIAAGLAADSPVAFLNRHRGEEETLDSWHWLTIMGLERDGEKTLALGYDEGVQKYFSPARWSETTLLGGGFVYLAKE